MERLPGREATPRRILIELDPDASPISGNVRADAKPPVSFAGWTGLFAVLREATGPQGPALDPGGDQ
jgi:hypothetical protein